MNNLTKICKTGPNRSNSKAPYGELVNIVYVVITRATCGISFVLQYMIVSNVWSEE